MKSVIFTEDSSTTAESTEEKLVRDYFRGGFLSVASLEEDLAEYGETELHILSEEYGHLTGNQVSSKISDSPSSGIKSFREALGSAVGEADVIVLLFTKSTFESVVKDSWQTLTSQARSGTIWCIGASKSALSSVDQSKLVQNGCEVLTYERVGVARIGSETRQKLLRKIESKTSQQR